MFTNQQVLIIDKNNAFAIDFRQKLLTHNAKVDAVDSVQAARRLVLSKHIDVAYIGLGRNDTTAMTRMLDENGIPYVFVPEATSLQFSSGDKTSSPVIPSGATRKGHAP